MRCKTITLLTVAVFILSVNSLLHCLITTRLINQVNELIDLQSKQVKVEFHLEGSDEFQRSVLNRKEAGT